jgi:hypothetical protein
MRYTVQYDIDIHRWVVVDTAICHQLMGVHVSEAAARQQAKDHETRWCNYDHFFMGVPPVDGVAVRPTPAKRHLPPRPVREPRWPARAEQQRQPAIRERAVPVLVPAE